MRTPTTFLEYREFLKQQMRIARNLKTCSSEKPSLFESSEDSLSQRLIDETPVLMPEILNMMNTKDHHHHHQKPSSKPTKPTNNKDHPKPSSKVTKANLSQRAQNRDYSSLLSENSEAPEVSKAAPAPPKPIPAEVNGTAAKKSQVSSLKPKKSGDDKNKSIVSKSDSVTVSGSKSLKSRPRENMVTESQPSSTKQSLKPKQAELSDTKVKPKKVIKRRRVEEEEDLEDDYRVDLSFMYKRGQREYGKNRYKGGDDRNMVTGFDDIMKEERNSEKRGREEDEEEARKIEEEERKERLKKAKKRKLMN